MKKRSWISALSAVILIVVFSVLFYFEKSEQLNKETYIADTSAVDKEDKIIAETEGTEIQKKERPAAVCIREKPDEDTLADLSITIMSYTDTPIIQDTESYIIIGICDAGTNMNVVSYEDPIWIYVSDESGTEGYVYGGDFYICDESGAPTADTFTDHEIDARISELQNIFPTGYYWNHIDSDPEEEYSIFRYTDIPCDHDIDGSTYCNEYNGSTLAAFPDESSLIQCQGFASLLSDYIFGPELSFSATDSLDDLQIGDHIRLDEYEHSMTVISIDAYGITVGEANENYLDCMIDWTREISFEELEMLQWDMEIVTRYPVFRDSEGNFITDGDHLVIR